MSTRVFVKGDDDDDEDNQKLKDRKEVGHIELSIKCTNLMKNAKESNCVVVYSVAE